MIENGRWLSILEYASTKGKSISTVRRYIKANRIKYKKENGKFYIWSVAKEVKKSERKETDFLELQLENQRLKDQLKLAQNQIDELTMLVDLYERGHRTEVDLLPDLPIND
jgi:hypothetical protein